MELYKQHSHPVAFDWKHCTSPFRKEKATCCQKRSWINLPHNGNLTALKHSKGPASWIVECLPGEGLIGVPGQQLPPVAITMRKASLDIHLHSPSAPTHVSWTITGWFKIIHPQLLQNHHAIRAWMICCYFLTSSSHPIQERFDKEHANSSNKVTWKGQPSPHQKVSMMSFFCGEIWERNKCFPWIQGRKQLRALWRKRNCFSVRCPLSLEALLPSPFFCLPVPAQTSRRH